MLGDWINLDTDAVELRELLRQLYFHHDSQRKNPLRCSSEYHKEILDKIKKQLQKNFNIMITA